MFRSIAAVQHIGDPTAQVRLLLNPEPLYSLPPVSSLVRVYANEPGIGNMYLLWQSMLKLVPNVVEELLVNLSVTQLISSIDGAGYVSSTAIASAEGNAPYTYRWSSVSGAATLENIYAGEVTVRAYVPNGGSAQGVVRCDITDAFNIKATVVLPWFYSSNLV